MESPVSLPVTTFTEALEEEKVLVAV